MGDVSIQHCVRFWVNLPPFLDHPELEFSGSIAHGGLVAGERSSSADGHLGWPERCEDFVVLQSVSEFRVRALAIAVLPWTARLDVKRLDTDPNCAPSAARSRLPSRGPRKTLNRTSTIADLWSFERQGRSGTFCPSFSSSHPTQTSSNRVRPSSACSTLLNKLTFGLG